jgi:hypothetical protein
MTYLIWRLHRTHAIVSAVAIVAITAVLVPTGIAIANSYHHTVTNCSVDHVGCGDIAGTVFGNVAVLIDLLQVAALAVPLVLGISWGAPLVAGEFEAGTEDFAWTQEVTRRRWVLTNIGWALLAAARGEVRWPHCSRGGAGRRTAGGPVVPGRARLPPAHDLPAHEPLLARSGRRIGDLCDSRARARDLYVLVGHHPGGLTDVVGPLSGAYRGEANAQPPPHPAC